MLPKVHRYTENETLHPFRARGANTLESITNVCFVPA